MSWFVPVPDAPFGTDELPYGVYSVGDGPRRVGVAMGDQVLDLAEIIESTGGDATVFRQPTLNPFMAAGPPIWAFIRDLIQDLLRDESLRHVVEPHLTPARKVTMHLPIAVADYVDFYASEHHASNVGRIFRPDGAALTPNWKHLPIGYHGRAGTVVVSGTEVVRPSGQRKAVTRDDPPVGAGEDAAPVFGPSVKLDIEAELGWVVGVGSEFGRPVPVGSFDEHIFGVVILNDWSARDIQAWEYVPLGPFLGKSFATSVSAWVLPLAALGEATVEVGPQPGLLDYLQPPGPGFDINVEVQLNAEPISTCPYALMYYTPAQMMAHLTVNGAHLRTGDLYGSGTISGPEFHQRGSLLELTWDGTQPLPSGATFLRDGDEVIMRATAPGAAGGKINLGEVRGTIAPAARP